MTLSLATIPLYMFVHPPTMSPSRHEYTVGCICPMGVELAPVKAMFDEIFEGSPIQRSQNSYTLGKMCGHNLVVAVLPEIGNNSVANVATQLLNDYPSIRFGLLVGIGGGVPDVEEQEYDIRLGDVAISRPTASFGGVVQYDLGKHTTSGGFERTGILAKPPLILRSGVEMLAANHRMNGSRVPQYLRDMLHRYPAMKDEYSHPGVQYDQLFEVNYVHPSRSNCDGCDRQRLVKRHDRRNTDPHFHYGTIGSANVVVKDARQRQQLRQALKVICVEMEAAGLMDSFPCLVIRGICDYADSHKNKKWQPYAAATAAAYMKELLSILTPQNVSDTSRADKMVETSAYKCGVNLFGAPDLADHLFVARDKEIQQMERILVPGSGSRNRRVLVLGGMGGIGKTQLSIAYAKRYKDAYSSIFWLNATSEGTLKRSFRALAQRLLVLDTAANEDDDALWIRVSNWLSVNDNSDWLLIYDDYDNPDEYNIIDYYPPAAHGSIVVTSRIPGRLNGAKVDVRPMSEDEDGLQVLSTRSEREHIKSDIDARQLVRRLNGHPLALATAGAYLKESSLSFSKYLRHYEDKWAAIASQEELADYPTRTLNTTWNISFTRILHENELSARLLKFLAYFDHRDIWYDIISGHQDFDAPDWLTQIRHSENSFEKALRPLVRYGFVEAHHKIESYSLHICVHDWALNNLNEAIDPDQYWLAFDCVAGQIGNSDWSDLSRIRFQRITPHAVRLAHSRFEEVIQQQKWTRTRLQQMMNLAELLSGQVQYSAAETMYQRALIGHEATLGPSHTLTLHTVNNLGTVYRAQGELDKAEQMYQRIISRTVSEMAIGADYIPILDAYNNLGLVYRAQGKLNEAEQIFHQALYGYEKLFGEDHMSTLRTVNNLGLLYCAQGKLEPAELMYQRALNGKERTLVVDHLSILDIINNIGNLYFAQNKLKDGEDMYQQALSGYEKALGPDHTSTLRASKNLGLIFSAQGKLDDAEAMFRRAEAGHVQRLGGKHFATLETYYDLGALHVKQGRLLDAEAMYMRALAGYRESLGEKHILTLDTISNLGFLCSRQGRLAEAEAMYRQALAGLQEVHGSNNKLTLQTVGDMGVLLRQQFHTCRSTSSSLARKKIVAVIELASVWMKQLPTLCNSLGRMLLLNGDDVNASIAFQQGIVRQQDKLVYSDIMCDGCEQDMTRDMGRHVCRTCWDTDLCSSCLDQYVSKDLVRPECADHAFFKVKPGMFASVAETSFFGRSSAEFWLGQLRKKYDRD